MEGHLATPQNNILSTNEQIFYGQPMILIQSFNINKYFYVLLVM